MIQIRLSSFKAADNDGDGMINYKGDIK
jgi:hypothetical protein